VFPVFRGGFTCPGRVQFRSPHELFHTGADAFGDGGVTGGDVDGEPYDTRVDLDSSVTTWSFFAADTLPIGSRIHVSLQADTIRRRSRTAIGYNPAVAGSTDSYANVNLGVRYRLTGWLQMI
jgi:hypothetical protein